MFEKRRCAPVCERAEVAVHGQVESGVVVFHGAEEFAYVHVDGEFFLEFAGERLLRGRTGLPLNVAPRSK